MDQLGKAFGSGRNSGAFDNTAFSAKSQGCEANQMRPNRRKYTTPMHKKMHKDFSSENAGVPRVLSRQRAQNANAGKCVRLRAGLAAGQERLNRPAHFARSHRHCSHRKEFPNGHRVDNFEWRVGNTRDSAPGGISPEKSMRANFKICSTRTTFF